MNKNIVLTKGSPWLNKFLTSRQFQDNFQYFQGNSEKESDKIAIENVKNRRTGDRYGSPCFPVARKIHSRT